jgi:hypothetical protein
MVIALARTASSTTWRGAIRPILITIILVDDLIPIQWSEGQKVAWLVLLAAWWLDLWPEIIPTIPTETRTGAIHLLHAGCLWSAAIDLISKGTWVFPLPIVHFATSFVKRLPGM